METISHSAFADGADAFVVAGAGGFGSAVRSGAGAAVLGGAEVGEGDAEGVGDMNIRSASAGFPSNRSLNAEKPRTMTGAGLSHNDCSAASYSPTGSPLQ
ncbi:hypothetical protein ACFWG0_33405, partial [Streptomyces yangpuensis]|uniref:hypothetical protein n=1 Tax=Streptomyces yangpuensis TaxID=1648182 RepID=UPI00365AC69F